MAMSHFEVERDYTKREPAPICPFMLGRTCQPRCRFYYTEGDTEDCVLRRMAYEVMQYYRFRAHI